MFYFFLLFFKLFFFIYHILSFDTFSLFLVARIQFVSLSLKLWHCCCVHHLWLPGISVWHSRLDSPSDVWLLYHTETGCKLNKNGRMVLIGFNSIKNKVFSSFQKGIMLHSLYKVVGTAGRDKKKNFNGTLLDMVS